MRNHGDYQAVLNCLLTFSDKGAKATPVCRCIPVWNTNHRKPKTPANIQLFSSYRNYISTELHRDENVLFCCWKYTRSKQTPPKGGFNGFSCFSFSPTNPTQRSPLWNNVSPEDRETCHRMPDNGEFWCVRFPNAVHLVRSAMLEAGANRC